MNEPTYTYDEISDTFSISFAPGEHATGIELTDHILLRINKRERRAIGITLFDYSLLAQTTDIGQQSFPLTGLVELSEDTRALVLEILRQPPVRDMLTIFAYTPSPSEQIPIIVLHPPSISTAA
jgi:uncharacterized protein YuzE